MRAEPFDQEKHWLVAPSRALPEGAPGFDEEIDIIHRPNCPTIKDLEYFDPDVHADSNAIYKTYFSFVKMGVDEPVISYFYGSPFEILCQMFTVKSTVWLFMDFCYECVEMGRQHPLSEFLSMLPNDDLSEVLSDMFYEFVDGTDHFMSRNSIACALEESSRRISTQNKDIRDG